MLSTLRSHTNTNFFAHSPRCVVQLRDYFTKSFLGVNKKIEFFAFKIPVLTVTEGI
jgi:hypothetical protein